MVKRLWATFIIFTTISCTDIQGPMPRSGANSALRMVSRSNPEERSLKSAGATKIITGIQKIEAKAPEQVILPEETAIAQEIPSREVSNSVGVLLPLSGSFRIYGERALAAMRLAFNPITSENLNGALVLKNQQGLALIIIDTKGQIEVAQRAVDRLVDEYRVGVIIGDILTDTGLAIAHRSKERDVINLSLSRKEGLTSIGSRIFRMAMTAKKQAAALISLGSEKRELKRFAVLYPENSFGIEMRDAFVSEVKSRGLMVAKVEGYKADETTFTAHVRRLVGPRKTSGNMAYANCMERSGRITDNAARKKSESDCYDAVAPTIAFEALFIPEFPKTLAYIVPALISEGMMVSQNEDMIRVYRRTSHLEDAVPVQLLGPSSWNSSLVGEKLGAQIDGALFVDSGNFSDARPEVVQFVDAFKNLLSSPPSLVDAFSHDSIRIIREIYRSADQRPLLTLEQISKGLQNIELVGVSGKISFDKERESVIPFRWFAFSAGKILTQS